MPALRSARRFLQWPFFAVAAVFVGSGCAVYRLARWPLPLLVVAMALGCQSLDSSDSYDEDCEETATANMPRGGGVSPAKMNQRAGYRNG